MYGVELLSGSERVSSEKVKKDSQDSKTQSRVLMRLHHPLDPSVTLSSASMRIGYVKKMTTVFFSLVRYIYWISLTSFWWTITASSSLLTLLEDEDSSFASGASSDPPSPALGAPSEHF